AAGSQHARDRKDPPFPRLVEDRLVRLVMDGTHAVHAAHVVDTVHDLPPGSETLPTPTIESRVTRAASCSSVMCPVPAGRSVSSRFLYAGSTQARATTRAPFRGPIFVS